MVYVYQCINNTQGVFKKHRKNDETIHTYISFLTRVPSLYVIKIAKVFHALKYLFFGLKIS